MAQGKKVQSAKKPAKNLSRVKKQWRAWRETKTDLVIKMVSLALKDIIKKDRNGVTLVDLREYLEDNFFLLMTADNKAILKKVLEKGFRVGVIIMTNDNGSKIDYKNYLAMDDDGSSSVVESITSDEDEE